PPTIPPPPTSPLSLHDALPILTFAFSYLVNANRFLMLGDYDYYFLTRHADNPNEPPHLSRRAKTPEARVEKSERILRSMLSTLQDRKSTRLNSSHEWISYAVFC